MEIPGLTCLFNLPDDVGEPPEGLLFQSSWVEIKGLWFRLAVLPQSAKGNLVSSTGERNKWDGLSLRKWAWSVEPCLNWHGSTLCTHEENEKALNSIRSARNQENPESIS